MTRTNHPHKRCVAHAAAAARRVQLDALHVRKLRGERIRLQEVGVDARDLGARGGSPLRSDCRIPCSDRAAPKSDSRRDRRRKPFLWVSEHERDDCERRISPRKGVLLPGAAVASITSHREGNFLVPSYRSFSRRNGGKHDALVWRTIDWESTSGCACRSTDRGTRSTQSISSSR